MVDWCVQNVPPSSSPKILEVGCGNGILLTSLVESGYDPTNIYGVDYSPDAVSLAIKVSEKHGESTSKIHYSVCDFLQDEAKDAAGESIYDLVLDKGTFDAMALAEKDAEGRSPSDAYPGRVAKHLRTGGYFLITCKCPSI